MGVWRGGARSAAVWAVWSSGARKHGARGASMGGPGVLACCIPRHRRPRAPAPDRFHGGSGGHHLGGC
eukprot:327104-Lingulodinium_polyedra.AAC.1